MPKSIAAAILLLSLSAPAHAASWACTCRDSEGTDIGEVTVTTSENASWDTAVRRANSVCKQRYENAADGANCDVN